MYQSGFRPGHSTVTATAKVVNDIARALDSKLDCVALSIHVSKAFDSVVHTVLLERLHNIGFDYNSWDDGLRIIYLIDPKL